MPRRVLDLPHICSVAFTKRTKTNGIIGKVVLLGATLLTTTNGTGSSSVGLEADLQDLTVITHEPSSFGIREGDGPETAHSGKREPRKAFIGRPGSFS